MVAMDAITINNALMMLLLAITRARCDSVVRTCMMAYKGTVYKPPHMAINNKSIAICQPVNVERNVNGDSNVSNGKICNVFAGK